MNIRDAGIPGVKIIRPKKHGDARGFLSEVYNASAFAEIGIRDTFVQDNHSLSAERGVVRGLHFQAPPHAQAKLLRVVHGAVFDVVVDIRAGSPSYGMHVCTELSADNWNQMYVPVGFAHGFVTLTPHTQVLYKVTDYYAPTHDFGLRWNDPMLGIEWPVEPAEAILSDRDTGHPLLHDLISPFHYGGEL